MDINSTFKQCADSLRSFALEKHEIKLKATHAHELVAAYFGYKSKNAAINGHEGFPVSNLCNSEIILMRPDNEIDVRRKSLDGLSPELPDSYSLGKAIFEVLFNDQTWVSEYPPFRSYQSLAKFLVNQHEGYKFAFKGYKGSEIEHIVDAEEKPDCLLLNVLHGTRQLENDFICIGQTNIHLKRVAARIGFGNPTLRTEMHTGQARRKVIFGNRRESI